MMASSSTPPSCCFYCNSPLTPSNSASISTTRFALFLSNWIFDGSNGISLKKARSSSTSFAKFEKFQGEDVEETTETSPFEAQEEQAIQDEEKEDDGFFIAFRVFCLYFPFGCLPSDLVDAVRQSIEASSLFVSSGGMRAIRVKAIFPDAGAATLLKYRWKDAALGLSSLSDRKPVESEDEIVVMVVPDNQMLGYVEKMTSNLSDDPA